MNLSALAPVSGDNIFSFYHFRWNHQKCVKCFHFSAFFLSLFILLSGTKTLTVSVFHYELCGDSLDFKVFVFGWMTLKHNWNDSRWALIGLISPWSQHRPALFLWIMTGALDLWYQSFWCLTESEQVCETYSLLEGKCLNFDLIIWSIHFIHAFLNAGIKWIH